VDEVVEEPASLDDDDEIQSDWDAIQRGDWDYIKRKLPAFMGDMEKVMMDYFLRN